MEQPNFYELYSSALEKVSRTSGNEYISLCPYHKENKPSFSWNQENGLHCCFSCDAKGNAEQFAKYIGHQNPKQYRVYDNNSYSMNTKQYKSYTSTTTEESEAKAERSVHSYDLTTLMGKYKNNLLNNKD